MLEEVGSATIADTTIVLTHGDITKETTDAVVNAANTSLQGGGGVDGAIHRAGGGAILEECRKIGRCKTGQAVVTTAGLLPSRYVIHTVGPVWNGGNQGEEGLLTSSYKESLCRADDLHLRSIAFPAISTGRYRFPLERAAIIALGTAIAFVRNGTSLTLVRFVLFTEDDLTIYRRVLGRLLERAL